MVSCINIARRSSPGRRHGGKGNSLAGSPAERKIHLVKTWLPAALLLCAAWPAAAALPTIRQGDTVVLPIHGAVTEAQFFFLRRIVKQAEHAGAAGIILDLDTPGGALQATENITKALLRTSLPVVAYVNTNAASAGALIALASREIYMAPVSAIGAAAPVLGTGQEMDKTMNAKVVSYYSGFFRSVASQRGHNPELVDAFMNLDKEVRVGDRVLNPKGSILTLSAQEAVEKIDGRPVLAKAIATSAAEVAEKAGFNPQRLAHVQPSGFETLAQWITMLAPMFLLGGIIGTYLEFKTPGFGVAGAIAAVCFTLFFAGHYIAGLTGFEAPVVFVLGLLLVLAELFFFPGVFFLAAVGTALMLGALFFAMLDYYPSNPLDIPIEALLAPAANLAMALVLAVVCGALLARFLPELPLFGQLVLHRAVAAGPAVEPPPARLFETTIHPGETGTTLTALRPSGKAEFGAVVADVVADGAYIEAGRRVRVTRADGFGVFVEEAS